MKQPAARFVLFDAAVLGPLRHAPGRSLLAIVAIALGVALGLAIHLMNRVAADEVAIAARSLFGQADLAVEGTGEGFDESLYPVLARIDGVNAVSPVVEVEAKLIGHRGALTILGMDAFRSRQFQPAVVSENTAGTARTTMQGEPIFLSAAAARDLNVAPGDGVRVQVGLEPLQFVVAGVLPAAALEDRAGIIDIATAQWRFDRLGKLSRINLKLRPGADPARVRNSLQAVLPAQVSVVEPVQAASDATRLSRAYRSNLGALALVALFTGGFFVYSTQSLATLRRRREFALLHALGVTRGEQLRLILWNGVLLGALGAFAGVVAGYFVARAGLALLGGDLGAGYFHGTMPVLELSALEILAFCALGTAVAVLGTVQPAIDAARIQTAVALKANDIAAGQMRPRSMLVAALIAASLLMLGLPPVEGLPLPGYVSIALFIIAVVAAMPSVLRMLLTHAPRLRSIPWEMAIAHLRGTARHATLSVAAIVVSFSLMVAMAIMVTSFRQSLDAWTQRLLPADLYLRSGNVGQSAHFDPAAVAKLRRIEGVAKLEASRFAQVRIDGMSRPVTLIARDLDPAHAERALWLESSSAAVRSDDALPIWISQAVADAADLRPGSMTTVAMAGRSLQAEVRGIWRDYEHGSGAIVMERARYAELTNDHAVNTVWLWLAPGTPLASVQQRIRDLLPAGVDYDMRTPGELRRLSLQAFDRTFAVTYALELIAVVIGLFGIAAGTSAQVLARRREIGVLRHLGLTRAQVGAMLAIEGAGLGALGVIAGLATGGWVSLILIRIVNRQSFHWSMDLTIPVAALAWLSAALMAAGALIAVISGRSAMRGDVIAAVKEDW